MEKYPSPIITIQAFMRGSKVRCGPERWNLMFWNLKRFIDKNGRVPCNGGCGGCKGCRRQKYKRIDKQIAYNWDTPQLLIKKLEVVEV